MNAARIPRRTLVAAVALVAACTAAAAGRVEVRFVDPEKFADAGASIADRERTLQALARHFEQAAAPLLADGQRLAIEVREVDLAGEVRMSRKRLSDVRVVEGKADWPRISLNYVLEAPGAPARRGQAQLSDMAYLTRLNRYDPGDPLRYERPMIDAWLRTQFAAAPR